MTESSTVTSKGQITLPSKIRKKMGVETGDTILFDDIDGTIVIRRVKNIENFFNTLPPLDFDLKEKLAETIAADSRGDQ